MHKQSIPVWDIAVRIFHWSLVLGFTIAWLTGDEEDALHIYAGYTVLGLIGFRLIWGFIGSRHARFGDFVTGPASVIEYLKSLRDRPRHYMGHNPAGGWMVVLMLLTLFGVTLSGLKVYGIEGHGPLAAEVTAPAFIGSAHAGDDDDDDRYGHETSSMETAGGREADEEFWEEIHETLSDFMLLLIALHIAGVIVSSRLHRENLVKAMITGNKEKLD